jgi:predicted DNA-binding transcriptional regulator AlpA
VLDPFPKQLLLDRAEVRGLLGMSRTGFEQWLKSDSAKGFPKPVEVGKTPNGRPVLKWKKHHVLAFIDLLGS